MHNKRLIITVTSVLISLAVTGYCLSVTAFEDDFSTDPLGAGSSWSLEGPNTSELNDTTPVPAFQSSAGTLTVNYNSLYPTSRLVAPLGTTVTGTDTFQFGATCAVSSANYNPDPNGYSGIMTFALVNSATTGTDRSGRSEGEWPDVTYFPGNTIDNVEMTYYPNVSIWGGPYVASTVIGGSSWYNMAFSAEEVTLPHDTPIEVTLDYNGYSREITYNVRRVGGEYIVRNKRIDVSGLSPTFQADSFAISMYNDGFSNPTRPSVVATAEFTNVFFRSGWHSDTPQFTEGAPSVTAIGLAIMAIALAATAYRKLAH